jgi:hypothetical protein
VPVKALTLLIQSSTHDNGKDEQRIENDSDKEYSLGIDVEPANGKLKVAIETYGGKLTDLFENENDTVISKGSGNKDHGNDGHNARRQRKE